MRAAGEGPADQRRALPDDALVHFKRAHELRPENWTYKRQAWSFCVAELYDARNVPAAFWIDERGRIVRANHPIYAQRRNEKGLDEDRGDTGSPTMV